MNKLIIITITALMLSACASTNEIGEEQQLTKDSKSSNCITVKVIGSRVAKKRCPSS